VTRTEAPATAGAVAQAPDLERVGELVDEGDPEGNLIALLQRAQHEFGFLPEAVVDEIARHSGVPASRLYGIITFYAQFSTVPSGRHKLCVCHGTACHVAGAPRITEAIEQELAVNDGGTTDDSEFSLDSVACMGACSQAPVMRIDEDTFGNLSADQTRRIVRGFVKELGLEAEYGGTPIAHPKGGGGDD
jgi:NADH-quinone oxidoreductase subunit E